MNHTIYKFEQHHNPNSQQKNMAFTYSILLFLSLQTLFLIVQATVPASETFKFVNEGEFGDYSVEYGGNYRPISIFNSPFQGCFYNTTPNAYTFALRMGTIRSESRLFWVWEANRGNPVRENATLTFGTDGNLVLADVDGRVAWQTNTANKGVVGFKVLPNGNMVLYDNKGNFLWQSFDSPTDTLLIDQSLRFGAATKLVSRASVENNSDGPYSLVLETKGLGLYYKSPNYPKPLLYFSSTEWFNITRGNAVNFTLTHSINEDEANATELIVVVGNTGSYSANRILARPKYTATLTFMRLGIDGSLKIYTFNNLVDWFAWEETYSLFSRDNWDVKECQLPSRCGKFGLCEDDQCVACPLPSGLMGWSKNCEPVKVPSCKASDIKYYKVEGVDHFLSKYTRGDGPIKEQACESKCTKDCKCMGYFYHKDTSRCWMAYDLKTLTKVENIAHVGYIKMPSH